MQTSRLCLLSVPILVTLSIALFGCDRGPPPPTNIAYRQIGLCKGYDTPAGRVKPASDEAFAVFKVEAVDNTKPTKSFVFDPALLYVDQSNPRQKAQNVWEWNRRFASTDPRFGQSIGVPLAAQVTVAQGDKLEIDRFVVVPVGVNNPSGGPEAKQYSLDLVYDTGSSDRGEEKISEGVVFTKTNGSDATWTVSEDCKAISLK